MEQMASLISLGDGSTLSLDFTAMSSLDSRFTFSRSSTATFINSSGLVRYADHNLVPNSAFVGSGIGTGWVQNGGGTFTNSGTGSITTAVTTSNQAYVSRTFVTKQGLRYSASVNVTSISGTINYNQVLAVAGSISADTFYRNGSVVNASTTAQTGLLTIIFTAGAGGTNTFRSGVGASGTNQTNVTVVFDSVRAVEGENTQPTYFVSPSGSEYQAPRFDYDPSTLVPRGLLLEGSATNLMTYSEDFNAAAWTDTSITRATGNADPAGGTTAVRFTASAGNATVIRAAAIGTSAERTFSVWLRRVTGTGNIQYTQNNGTNWTTQAITSTWTRYTFTHTVDHRVGIRIVTSGDAIEMWGAQLETGSGASSYIPTGASTVQRAADSCQLTGTNFSSWFNATEGTFLARGQRRLTSNTGMLLSANDATNSEAMGLGSSTTGRWLIRDGGSDVASISPGTVTANTTYRIAGAYAVNDAQAAFNGTLGTQDTSLALPTVNQLDIGRDRVTVYLDGYVELIKYWPTRLPDAQLQAITA